MRADLNLGWPRALISLSDRRVGGEELSRYAQAIAGLHSCQRDYTQKARATRVQSMLCHTMTPDVFSMVLVKCLVAKIQDNLSRVIRSSTQTPRSLLTVSHARCSHFTTSGRCLYGTCSASCDGYGPKSSSLSWPRQPSRGLLGRGSRRPGKQCLGRGVCR